MTIKPLETRYAGCRFRSRLEARWAVFLDEMRIGWEYEPQGFQTSAGPYLPDFRVKPECVQHHDNEVSPAGHFGMPTEGDVYLEVKGAPLSLDEAERIRAFACDPGPARWVLALGPIPSPADDLYALNGWGMGGAGRAYLRPGRLSMEHPYSMSDAWGPTRPDLMDLSFRSMSMTGPGDRHVTRALTAARSARFEHGESGVR